MQVKEMLYSKGYRLGPRIGKGSYAKVKLAERLSDNKIMAAKIVNRHRAAKEFLSKFLPRELAIVLSLSHRNIIQIYEADEMVCVMMEFACGGDLLDYIKKHGALKENEAGFVFAQVCEAVNYIHDRNICHRDLKCENILLRRNMSVALSDFGFSKLLLTRDALSDTYCGSAAYASPELLRGTPYGPMQNDIWSLGCIVFIMVTGQMPFYDKNTRKMMYRQLKGKVNFPEHRHVSLSCRSLIVCMLEPDINLRYNIKTVLSHSWLQPFVRLVDNTFNTHFQQSATADNGTDISYAVPNVSSENTNDSLIDTVTHKEFSRTTKDIWNHLTYDSMLNEEFSVCFNDSVNEHLHSVTYGNTSLCRMPGEACILRSLKVQHSSLQNEDNVLVTENQISTFSRSFNGHTATSNSSLGTNPNSSILNASASTDQAILPYQCSLCCNNPYINGQELPKDSAVRTTEITSDQHFKKTIQKILHMPDSETENSNLQRIMIPTITSKTPYSPQSTRDNVYITNVDASMSDLVTPVTERKKSGIIKNSKFQQTNITKHPKPDASEPTRVHKTGLVTQMRRIFESKDVSTSTINRHSVNKKDR